MNKNLFASGPKPDTVNHAGAPAFALDPKDALAQLACTGFFADTFYVSAEEQLANILAAAKACPDEFVAQVALYARHSGYMKDAPAVLLAYLHCKRSPVVTPALFRAVCDNAKMVSNFVQAVRSGQFGRKSLGHSGQRLVSLWLKNSNVDYLWRQSIAKNPSIADIIKLSRPKVGRHGERWALHQQLLGKPVPVELLPPLVQQTLAFRADQTKPLPDVPFNLIDSVTLTPAQWATLFERGGWQFTRMNLATAQRQGVFKDPAMVKLVAERLANKEEVAKARQFPYQILMAYAAVQGDVDMPQPIKSALHDAMEAAIGNVPAFEGDVYVAVDCSGSMSSPATGKLGKATSKVQYCDIAALFAAAVARKSPNARIITFNNDAVFVPIEPRDTTMTIAQKLSAAGGGTDMSSPLRLINREKRHVDLYITISDMESWLDGGGYGGQQFLGYRQTGVGLMVPVYSPPGQTPGTVASWRDLKRRCPNAKQVRINISPNATDQLEKRSDTLRVGGFSDAVFTAIANFATGKDWTATISAVTLPV